MAGDQYAPPGARPPSIPRLWVIGVALMVGALTLNLTRPAPGEQAGAGAGSAPASAPPSPPPPGQPAPPPALPAAADRVDLRIEDKAATRAAAATPRPAGWIRRTPHAAAAAGLHSGFVLPDGRVADPQDDELLPLRSSARRAAQHERVTSNAGGVVQIAPF